MSIIPQDTDVEDIFDRLTVDPQTKVSELDSKNIFSDTIAGIISQHLAEKTTLSKEDRTAILRQVALVLRTNLDGPVKYESPDFSIEMKVELVENACDNLRTFLSGFIEK